MVWGWPACCEPSLIIGFSPLLRYSGGHAPGGIADSGPLRTARKCGQDAGVAVDLGAGYRAGCGVAGVDVLVRGIFQDADWLRTGWECSGSKWRASNFGQLPGAQDAEGGD